MSGSRLGRVLVAGGVTLAAFVALGFLAVPALLVPGGGLTTVLLAYSLPEFGFAAVGVAFLAAVGEDRTYLDVAWPDARDLAVSAVATAAAVAFNLAAHWGFAIVGFETAPRFDVPPGVAQVALFVGLSVVFLVVVGPFEELFFRGVLQRYLREDLTGGGAVAWASAFFAALHFPGLLGADGGPAQFVLVGGVLLVVSLLLGLLYEATENLAVPVLVHGWYDVCVLAALLLGLFP